MLCVSRYMRAFNSFSAGEYEIVVFMSYLKAFAFAICNPSKKSRI